MRSRFRAFVDYMRFVYGSEWVYVVGFLSGVLGIVVGVAESSLSRDFIVIAGVLGVCITLLFLARDSLALYRRWASAELVYGGVRTSAAYFSGVQWASTAGQSRPRCLFKASATDRDGFIDLAGAVFAHAPERIWRDSEIDRELRRGSGEVRVELRKARYQLPESLQGLAPRALRATNSRSNGVSRNRRPTWFNGRLCRLMTEPTLEQLKAGRLGVQEVTYFDGQVSNELWSWSLDSAGREPAGFFRDVAGSFIDLARNFRRRNERNEATTEPIAALNSSERSRSVAHSCAVDGNGNVLGLSDARMANIVGITVFAITADGYVLFVRQSEKNSELPHGFAASASGSLDWRDAKQVARPAETTADGAKEEQADINLRDLLVKGMLRELHEESQVEPHEVCIETAVVTGYFRWLRRGAKPEFTGLVRLNVGVEQLHSRSPRGDEVTYTEALGANRPVVPLKLLSDPENGWGGDQLSLRQTLSRRLTELVPVGASSIAAWCAAAEFLRENPGYLADFQS